MVLTFINTYMNTTITAAQSHVKHLDALFCDGEKNSSVRGSYSDM